MKKVSSTYNWELLEKIIRNSVGRLREERGLSVAALAVAVEVSRQAMYAIEAGTYVPNTTVSLRLARELGVAVEELFQLEAEPVAQNRTVRATVLDTTFPFSVDAPVQLGYVDERLVAAVAPPSHYWLSPADGLVKETVSGGRKAIVEIQAPESRLRNRLLISGCDPAMSVLARHLQRTGIELLLIHQNSSQSLAALKRGDVHVAGTHLRRAGASDPNLSTIALTFPKDTVAVVAFALWQEGFVTAPGNPKSIRTVEDLTRRQVRFVNREPGAGCRALLDTKLAEVGMPPARIAGYSHEAHGHLEAAAYVKAGSTDCCIATRAAAYAFGLGFVPIEEARYDLVVRKENLKGPAFQKVFDAISRLSFRQELGAASGYDTRVTGERVL